MKIKDRDDDYLRKHFTRLIKEHGGQWIVIVNGRKFAIVPKSRLSQTMKKARKLYPRQAPLVSPIPTSDELQCILKF